MTWLKKLGKYAPDIAAAIATGGTSVVASTALRIVAQELTGDSETPVAMVKETIESTSHERMTALVKVNHDFTVALETIDLQRMQAVNETMRVESASEHWYQAAWRPFWGFVTGMAFTVIALCLAGVMVLLSIEKPGIVIANLPMIIGSITTLFGIPGAILGVSAWHRGKEKRLKAGEIISG